MRKLLFPLFSLIIFSTSCGVVKSSLEYTKGTECIEAKNFDAAILHLERAVELDPDMGRNYTNLTFAYLETDQMEKAWLSSRKGVLCKYLDQNSIQNFFTVFQKYVYNKSLAQPGTEFCDIREKLGEPDFEEISKDRRSLVYGIAIFIFENDVLSTVFFKNELSIISVK